MIDRVFHSSIKNFNSIRLDDINQLKLLKRVDNKFVMPIEKLDQLLDSVKEDYDILEINGERNFKYHTVYFDTPQLSFYLNHHNSRLNRYKVRMRTYKISNHSFLELKRKNNKGKTIKSRRQIDEITNLTDEHYDYLNTIIPISESNLEKSVENTFMRITLVSFKTLERVTIDYDLKFLLNDKTTSLPFISIVEVKRDKMTGSSPIISALKKMKVYSKGFSKYCMGMAYMCPDLKQNRFKANKLYLNKLKYVTTTNC